ncbi:hypothetical protein [Undibacterium sp. TS12]|uniref:hypothetical protein n=1 Tax=Undibacterium sp. TS12 TaxID=2908202 RepID=UPI001F4C7609|nr:hypothetical protein [Undibacterium sp. TS12]MCH8622779.1 hypothetical protein [Undibacterium sp. TS12]
MTFTDYVNFEKQLNAAFPLERPQFAWPRDRIGIEAQEIFAEYNWREMPGFSLRRLDCSLSHNLQLFPMIASVYYLPAFLKLGALSLYYGGESHDYPYEVAAALFLPLDPDVADFDEIDSELTYDGSWSVFPHGRVDLYNALNQAQRACAARYLEIYRADYGKKGEGLYLSERGKLIFQCMIDTWNSAGLLQHIEY